MKPISPDEISNNLAEILPHAVISAINNLLKDSYRGHGSVTIKQKDVVAEIMRLNPAITKEEIFAKKYLDIEQLYSRNGWVVKYDKPAYDENYDAFFEFTAKRYKKA